MKPLFSLLLLAFPLLLNAQLNESFSDGDFTANPVWTGTSTTFIVNASQELQTTNTVAATSYLTTPHGLSTLDGQEWRVRVKIITSPSSANFGRVYLTSTSADLTTNPDGFFLQLGEAGSTDAIRLKKIVGGVETEICAGPSAQIATSFNISIRIVRDGSGLWSLYTDAAGGNDFAFQASGTDVTALIGTHAGVWATYTASNATKYYFDDLYAGPEIVDTQAPALLSATAVSPTQVDLLFDEPIAGTAAVTTGNYTFEPAIVVSSASFDGSNLSLIHLQLGASLSNGQTYTVTVNEIEDANGNQATNLVTSFEYLVNEIPEPGDVIITEFLCDPSPVMGLADVEFVEIHNVSTKYFDLTGWKLGDASGDGTIVSGWIQPGEYKVLCAASSATFYPDGYTVSAFPSLNNTSDAVVLKDTGSVEINRVNYTDDWYRDEIKQEGGYSLELINPNDPCPDGSNWIASNAISGGTPGAQNSVYDDTPDTEAPALVSVLATAPSTLQLVFSEGMDSTTLVNAVLTTNTSLTVSGITAPAAFADTVTITFGQAITQSQLYSFNYGSVSDCWGNSTTVNGTFALAEAPQPGDLVINELLFDPGTGGSDFVELYNRSAKVLDLYQYELARYDDGAISGNELIEPHYLLFPGEYVVLTPDSNFQLQQFPQAVSGTFLQMDLPLMNNDSSTVLLICQGVVLDRVSYTSDWHLSLIDDTENKTLERIDPNGVSSSASNWHTAAENIGFGTPGRQNSQYMIATVNGDFGTISSIFSPDNDGFEDVLLFYYTMPQGEMIATVKIYDERGRLVRELVKSEVLSLLGNFSWDGINDQNTKAQLGVYLAVIEAFSVDGNADFSKRIAFTLAGKLD